MKNHILTFLGALVLLAGASSCETGPDSATVARELSLASGAALDAAELIVEDEDLDAALIMLAGHLADASIAVEGGEGELDAIATARVALLVLEGLRGQLDEDGREIANLAIFAARTALDRVEAYLPPE